jgi:hypothetical protein
MYWITLDYDYTNRNGDNYSNGVRNKMITYDTNSKNIVISTTPRVEFDDTVPTWFINEFLRRMAKGQIKVKDSTGKELKVYYETE